MVSCTQEQVFVSTLDAVEIMVVCFPCRKQNMNSPLFRRDEQLHGQKKGSVHTAYLSVGGNNIVSSQRLDVVADR